MINFIQINTGTCRESHSLLYATASQHSADILLVSEQYKKDSRPKLEDTSKRAAIINFSGLAVDKEGQTENGFVWAKIKNINIYSCYWSPNSTIEEYNDFLDRLQNSIRRERGEAIIAGDFNAKHVAWGSPINDTRGEKLIEMIYSLNMIVCNEGQRPTFERDGSSSYIDITAATELTASMMYNWKVLTENSLSLHNYITFNIATTKSNAATPTGWNTHTMDKSKALEMVEHISPFTWPETAEDSASKMAIELEKICDSTMKKRTRSHRKTVYWWTREIAELRKTSNHLRRKYQRKRKRQGAEACAVERAEAKSSKLQLVKAIKRSKESCWKSLCNQVENDPWGLPYRIVMGKLFKNPPIPEIESPGRIDHIIEGLFPKHPPKPQIGYNVESETTGITREELLEATNSLSNNKAPGPDRVPAEVLKVIIKHKPEIFLDVFNKCLYQGCFPKRWKNANLVLIRKGDKPF